MGSGTLAEGARAARGEASRAAAAAPPRERLPEWMRVPLRTDGRFREVHRAVSRLGLHTVCASARCPNRHECWNAGTATVMLLGDACTRHCRFCAVRHGVPGAPDPGEPGRVAQAARALGLRHVVLTSVTRDDLPEGGAEQFAATVRALRRECPEATVEVLTPDFGGSEAALSVVLDASPDVFNHNLETVRRLQSAVRPEASYDRSLGVLAFAARRPSAARIKSGLMLGMGETAEERLEAMRDLRTAGCELLTLGQYLAPGRAYWPVAEYVTPAAFRDLAAAGRAMGFAEVASGPRVRSSYEAERLYRATERPPAAEG